jgi:hypothetical protein
MDEKEKAELMALLKGLRDEAFKMGFASKTGRMRDLDFHHNRVQVRMMDLAVILDLDPQESQKWEGD